jgi:hypothetical protein
MADWYRDHPLSPEAYSDREYLDWAQDKGLYVDAAGNVDYGPPEVDDERPKPDDQVAAELDAGDAGPCAECGGSGSCPYPRYCWGSGSAPAEVEAAAGAGEDGGS